jgi:hypothetical protein
MTAVLLTGCKTPGVLGKLPSLPKSFVSPDGFLPNDAFMPGWHIVGKKRWFPGDKLEGYIGRQSVAFTSYGTSLLITADYGPPKSEVPVLTIENYEMSTPLAASGIFHYHRGKILRGKGIPTDIGIEGVMIKGIVYFYKSRYFIKVIYTGGDDKSIDLVGISRKLAAKIPGGARPPRGFEYLNVEGVNPKSSRLSAGYTFNYDFLPPAIFSKAPGAGSIAEVFLIGHYDQKTAKKTARDYRYFLEKYGLDYSFKRSGRKRLIWWARDPTHGRVIASNYGPWVIGVLTPQTYEKGEVIIDRIVELIKD